MTYFNLHILHQRSPSILQLIDVLSSSAVQISRVVYLREPGTNGKHFIDILLWRVAYIMGPTPIEWEPRPRVQRFEEARRFWRESFDLLCQLRLDKPEAYHEDVAIMLQNYALFLISESSLDEIADNQGRGIALWRRLHFPEPWNHAKGQTDALYTYGTSSHESARYTKACEVYDEYYTLRRQLHSHQLEKGDALALASDLRIYGRLLRDFHFYEKAFDIEEEAVNITRALYIREPGVFVDDALAALRIYGRLLRDFHFYEKALAVEEEAVNITRAHYIREPGVFVREFRLAEELFYSGVYLSDLSAYGRASCALAEGVEIVRRLGSWPYDGPFLANYLLQYGSTLHKLGDYKRALMAEEEGIRLARSLDDNAIHSGHQTALRDHLEVYEISLRVVGAHHRS